MNDSDKRQFMELMTATMKYYDKDVDPGSMGIYWNGLAEYEFDAVKKAFSQHIANGKFMPKVADIRDIMPDNSGWQSPEEAWNQLPKTEYDGGYVNQGIMAGFGACIDSLDRGDMIGARMAFLEAYKRHIQDGKLTGERPEWYYSPPSIGSYDQKQDDKQRALIQARDKKWISAQDYNNAVMQLDAPAMQQNPALAMLQQSTGDGLKKIASE